MRKKIEFVDRRNFLKLAGTGTCSTVAAAMATSTLWPEQALAQTPREEREREAAAEHTMTLATAYVAGASRSFPIMQRDFKENIQNATNGKVYVRLASGGQLGAEGALVQKVQAGTIQAAQHSLSNFAPFAPAVDLINLPYFCGQGQQFVNLVYSDAWKKDVETRVEERGFKVLYYPVIDPRVVAMRRGLRPAFVPKDIAGIKFRIPGSAMLAQYYQLLGANPTPIAWGETPSALKQGVADALDSSPQALHVFGFKDVIAHITFTKPVPDGLVFSCNLEWFRSLPPGIQESIDAASKITARQNMAKVPAARNYVIAELRKAGVEFHSLNDEQLKQWKDAGGYQRSEWDKYKIDLAGSMAVFKRLEEAANTKSQYYVQDV